MTAAAVRKRPGVPPEAEAALAEFGFGHAHQLASLYAHAPVFRVTGPGGDWVVKRSGMVHSGAAAIDCWLRHLGGRGVAAVMADPAFAPNPRPMPDRRHWVVYPFIQGRPYDGSSGDILAAGALLGHMHVAGAFNDWGLTPYFRPPERGSAWIDRHAAAACAAMRAAGLDTSRFRRRLAERRTEAPPPRGLPMAGGSFDFKASNLVFTPAPVLIDPDHAAFLPRIYDLAIAAMLFHDDMATAPGRLWTQPEWQAFLAGYSRTVRLDAAERAAWPDMLRRAWLDQAVWLLGNAAGGWTKPRERAFLDGLATTDLDAFGLPP